MDLKIFDRMESEVRGYIRSFPVIFSQARGSTLVDEDGGEYIDFFSGCLLYTSPSPRDKRQSRMPSSA